MPHPSLGLPPADTSAGMPHAAARLRANRSRIAKLALQAAINRSPGLDERYDETMLRMFLRDYDRHIEQLARAYETGDDSHVVNYGEWLVPVYRRRRVPMNDFVALVAGLEQAAMTLLAPEERAKADEIFDAWALQLKRHGRLPGDHKGNAVIRFFWKGAGVGDDKWI
jgi:hypothetical protein